MNLRLTKTVTHALIATMLAGVCHADELTVTFSRHILLSADVNQGLSFTRFHLPLPTGDVKSFTSGFTGTVSADLGCDPSVQIFEDGSSACGATIPADVVFAISPTDRSNPIISSFSPVTYSLGNGEQTESCARSWRDRLG